MSNIDRGVAVVVVSAFDFVILIVILVVIFVIFVLDAAVLVVELFIVILLVDVVVDVLAVVLVEKMDSGDVNTNLEIEILLVSVASV
jgi:hypothetical protein